MADQYNTAASFTIKCMFANGVEMLIRDKAPDLGFDNGIMFEGEQGRYFVNRGKFTGKPVEDLKKNPLGAGGHIQVLNSFGEQGMWDEAGSFYKEMPPQVNAAAPPLQWQTYDVEVDLPENPNTHDRALITVRLNGILVHNRHERRVGNAPLVVMLEDHINRMQFRNIWIEQ